MENLEIKLVAQGNALIKGCLPLSTFMRPFPRDPLYFSSSFKSGRQDVHGWIKELLERNILRFWLVDDDEGRSKKVPLRPWALGIEAEYPNSHELWIKEHLYKNDTFGTQTTGILFNPNPLRSSLKKYELSQKAIRANLIHALQNFSDVCGSRAPEWKRDCESLIRELLFIKSERNYPVLPQVYSQEAKQLLWVCLEALQPIAWEIPFGENWPFFPDAEENKLRELRMEVKRIANLGKLAAVNSINLWK